MVGYPCKVQKIQREKQDTYYISLPAALVEALEIKKGEVMEWFIEDRNTLVLQRRNPIGPRKFKRIP
jgi:bifunctional DNA-binding transcriptional regulator/antitoxin component of YhaV-PrlF toxin-antitoxin module